MMAPVHMRCTIDEVIAALQRGFELVLPTSEPELVNPTMATQPWEVEEMQTYIQHGGDGSADTCTFSSMDMLASRSHSTISAGMPQQQVPMASSALKTTCDPSHHVSHLFPELPASMC